MFCVEKKHLYSEVFRRLRATNPNPKIELDYISPYTLSVAVILSAQSTDVGVNKVTPMLFEIAPSPEKMIELGVERLRDIIKTIGLYNAKANNIIKMSEMLVKRFGSEIPSKLSDLMSLPGIGSKSARVIANTVFGERFIAVDTHVYRVSNRVGLCSTKNVKATEAVLEANVPDEYLPDAHHWLVLHGRYICKAIKPKCDDCVLSDICVIKSQWNKTKKEL